MDTGPQRAFLRKRPKTLRSSYDMPMSTSSTWRYSLVMGSSSAVGGAERISLKAEYSTVTVSIEVLAPLCEEPLCDELHDEALTSRCSTRLPLAHAMNRRRSHLLTPPMGLMSALEQSYLVR